MSYTSITSDRSVPRRAEPPREPTHAIPARRPSAVAADAFGRGPDRPDPQPVAAPDAVARPGRAAAGAARCPPAERGTAGHAGAGLLQPPDDGERVRQALP